MEKLPSAMLLGTLTSVTTLDRDLGGKLSKEFSESLVKELSRLRKCIQEVELENEEENASEVGFSRGRDRL